MNAATTSPTRRWWQIPAQALLFTTLAFAAVLPLLRVTRVVSWPWALVLAPFTAVGMLSAGGGVFVLLRDRIRALRGLADGSAGGLTEAPEQLEPPLVADEAGDGILVKHPELLAAICHGFRRHKFQPRLLGRPITDPWGMYQAVAAGSSLDYQQFRALVRRHTEALAEMGRKKKGRRPSDSQALHEAVRAFQRCSARTEKGRGDPDCTFEHVAAIFGARVPSRDAQLKTIAPKVRKLLERQYPQLATASLADGSRVKYDEWQNQATRDRRELAMLRKAHDRVNAKLEQTQAELAQARAHSDALRDRIETDRQAARTAARVEREQAFDELRAQMDRERAESARQLQRLELERDRLAATVEALNSERDSLERALFESDESEDDGVRDEVSAAELVGLRVLLVGGAEHQIPPIREHLAAHGVQLLHQDDPAAAERVAGVHVVVLWIRFVSHPTALTVKRECRLRGVPVRYWSRTAPASLVGLLAKARADVGVVAGDNEE